MKLLTSLNVFLFSLLKLLVLLLTLFQLRLGLSELGVDILHMRHVIRLKAVDLFKDVGMLLDAGGIAVVHANHLQPAVVAEGWSFLGFFCRIELLRQVLLLVHFSGYILYLNCLKKSATLQLKILRIKQLRK